MTYTLGELAAHVQGTLKGDADCEIDSVASLQSAVAGQLTFITSKEYSALLTNTSASAVVLSEDFIGECPVSAIVCNNPHLAFTKIAQLLNPIEDVLSSIHESAVIDDSASIDDSAFIGANCVIGPGVVIGSGVYVGPGCTIGSDSVIGDSCRLISNVTLCDHIIIGRRAIIHPGVVIGADGFGLSNDDGVWLKVPQLGKVTIGDDVEIGANTTIDRGALDDTVIGNGVKLDNQIQIAHNVQIGDHTAVAGCVGIAGSAHIGNSCTIGGGVGILGHLHIVDDVHVTAMSLVTKSITEPGVYSSGTPLQENREWHRNFVRYRQLDDMAKRLKHLEKQLALMEKD